MMMTMILKIKIMINIKSYLSRSDWPYADLGVGVVGAQLMMIKIKMLKITMMKTTMMKTTMMNITMMKITMMKITMMKITVMKIGSELQVQQLAYMFLKFQ